MREGRKGEIVRERERNETCSLSFSILDLSEATTRDCQDINEFHGGFHGEDVAVGDLCVGRG